MQNAQDASRARRLRAARQVHVGEQHAMNLAARVGLKHDLRRYSVITSM
jgi:hypothetical protein